MEHFANDLLELLDDDYIGDELTIDDLKNAYAAFLEDEKLDSVAALEFA
jgi:hypothetical protein